MRDIIQLLPDSIANQIAAGEVVQRPASVVKELLENAIDAGANAIQLIVKDAGRTLIQVVDNGSGMSETDARMCFERHATSKIRTADDLFKIRTMGFRGEAMASIAAVAQVELKTRREQDELGTQIRIEASEVKSHQPCQTPSGTTIFVKNLFFNVPARRNFLKSNPVEMRHILDEFQRVALAYPEIAFTLHHGETEVYNLGSGKLSRRIVDLFGKNYREQLAETREETPFVKVSGYIGKPEFAKKVRGEQFFFVNQRFIRHAYLHHAVLNGFEGLIAENNHPFYVLNIEIDPAHIDINVHPTKTEIKFDDEKSVYAIVRAAVKKATGVYGLAPAIDFEMDVNLLNPSKSLNFQQRDYASHFEASVNENRKVSDEEARPKEVTSFRPSRRNPQNWEQLFEGLEGPPQAERHSVFDLPTDILPTEKPFTPPSEPVSSLTFQSKANRLPDRLPEEAEKPKPTLLDYDRMLFQVHNRYVLSQVKSGLMVVDQRAAYERILYDKYRASLDKRNAASQQLLFPKTITLNPVDFQLVLEIQHEIRALGFDFAEIGKNAFIVYGIPTDVTDENEEDLFEGLLSQFRQHFADLRLDRPEALARSFAKRSAARYLVRLSTEEMSALVDQLFASSNPSYTPGGEPTFSILSLDKLGSLLR
ncbi:DNA mismatch repair endonuclease MutL [Siphonobacter aquaeclarae]|uniref:DNA mismatch repair protein MutL n=1 Tax=Siphonobacter aquaeclarae TaxID=563176 RepID=A0A1G9MV15_9BACT|nr:DNA mismatch repair endonuclease MutL [Siphonobacter aquaeclarae]SDL77851.1 DNA mismatch repair protein MutL [Siphonobacter aquaeclarae]